MVSDIHYIELYVNNELLELTSQESLNLRFNTVLFDPTKIATTQAEYSFSFTIPSTPSNDRILGYANTLSRVAKFKARYPAQVYADSNLVFDGSLTIRSYSSRDKRYTCNLVSIKVDSLDDIFGDSTLTSLKWEVPFDGAPTINEVNQDLSTRYYFPFICYGAFQKTYESKDEVAATYTPKHSIDKYNRFWVESFYPSLNMMETVRKAFESKGYKVGGSAFSDPNISEVYMSCNLADEQVPLYNLGNPKFGKLSMEITWNNASSSGVPSSYSENQSTYTNSSGGIPQDLKFPYAKVKPAINASNFDVDPEYNFSTAMVWNVCDSTNNTAVTVTLDEDSYLYDPNESVVVIPADGWYNIHLDANIRLLDPNGEFTAKQWTNTFYEDDEYKQRDVTIHKDMNELTPIEIQLVRNYDEDIELIKGSVNVEYASGDPNETECTMRGGSYTGHTIPNRTEWRTDFPHMNKYGSKSPTKTDDILTAKEVRYNYSADPTTYEADVNTSEATSTSDQGHVGVTRGHSGNVSGRNFGWNRTEGIRHVIGQSDINSYGYIHKSGFVMPYDPCVNPNFICGFSSLGEGTVSVMRDGYSWSKMCTARNDVFAPVEGMDLVNKSGDTTVTIPTEYCKNTFKDATYGIYANKDRLEGSVDMSIYLKKDDILEVMAVQRDYDGQFYACEGTMHLVIKAMSQETKEKLKSDQDWGWLAESRFPKDLNLFNFTNKETRVSDWISNVVSAFNLSIEQDGKRVDINTNKGIKKSVSYAVELDDKASSSEATAEYISYPREMSVKYRINTDEYGFELTVPKEYIDAEDWASHGDSGYTVISLSDDSYETSTQNLSTNFSYTYYDYFTWNEVNRNREENGNKKGIWIPILGMSEYMAEGYGYEEAMKHDGYSLTQRMWYRMPPSQEYVYLADHMQEQVFLTYASNSRDSFNLSYKDTERSIVTEYFNMSPMLSSNYVTIDVYLNPIEYNSLKGGALAHFDSDLYYVSEISGYDPSGGNTTSLKLIKKL